MDPPMHGYIHYLHMHSTGFNLTLQQKVDYPTIMSTTPSFKL